MFSLVFHLECFALIALKPTPTKMNVSMLALQVPTLITTSTEESDAIDAPQNSIKFSILKEQDALVNQAIRGQEMEIVKDQ